MNEFLNEVNRKYSATYLQIVLSSVAMRVFSWCQMNFGERHGLLPTYHVGGGWRVGAGRHARCGARALDVRHCGDVLPRDSGFKLSDGQFICAKFLLEKGIGNFPGISGWNLGTLRSYIDGRGAFVASYEPSKVVAGGRLKVDVGHELFCICNNILPYDSLLGCKLVDKCWPAEVGGAIWCHELLVMVTLRRAHVDVQRIPFTGADAVDAEPVAASSAAYRNARDDAYARLAVFEQIDRMNRARELQEAVAAAIGEAETGTKV